MGMSASQARLLTITARLTSNEYESQQISNAKTRLAAKSQEASRDYIAALDAQCLQFVTYDAQGAQVTQNLTANALYNYSEFKNQYMLSNVAGQSLVLSPDVINFRNSKNLDEFLACYGIEKIYKSESMANAAKRLQCGSNEVAYIDVHGNPVNGVRDFYDNWEAAVDMAKNASYSHDVVSGFPPVTTSVLYNAREAWNEDKLYYKTYLEGKQDAYRQAEANAADDPSDNNLLALKAAAEAQVAAAQHYNSCIDFDTWAQWMAFACDFSQVNNNIVTGSDILQAPISGIGPLTPVIINAGSRDTYYSYLNNATKDGSPVYQDSMKYFEVVNEFLSEAEDIGCTTLEDTYQYSDEPKAQWYTNLWYQMNGDSTFKSTIGQNETNFTILDNSLAMSSDWIKKGIKDGTINFSAVANEKELTKLNIDINSNGFTEQIGTGKLLGNPLNIKLRGITWRNTELSACSEFIQKDDDAAIARAQAEYERKTNEISAKDKKYEAKIKTLDTEHNALQQEYNSVKSAMDQNIERSYKTFNG